MNQIFCKRRFLAVVFLMAVCFINNFKMISAAEQSVKQQYLQYAEKMRKEQVENRARVEKAIKEFANAEMVQDITESGEKVKPDADSMVGVAMAKQEQFDMEQAYQVNRLKLFFVTESEKSGFESCITDEVIWMVPYDTKVGAYGLASFNRDQENGGFRFTGASEWYEPGQMEATPPAAEEIAGIFQEAAPDAKIQKVQYTYAGLYCMTLIYIQTSQKEYIIPYAENETLYQKRNPDSKLHNGNVYEMGKFMKEMEKISDEEEMLEGDGDLNYGTAFHHGQAGITLQGVIAAILLAVVVGVTAAIVGKKRKNAGNV